jgi:hypothetical protein
VSLPSHPSLDPAVKLSLPPSFKGSARSGCGLRVFPNPVLLLYDQLVRAISTFF